MSRYIQAERDTPYLFPPSVEDSLPAGHLARFIVEVIEPLDLRRLTQGSALRGSAAHHPAVLLALLVFGYATGVFSSRKIERATYDSVAFRSMAANPHHDHDPLVKFRRSFLPEREELCVPVLSMAQAMKLVRLGQMALDGSKLNANASQHKALSYGPIEKLETQRREEVQALLAKAAATDAPAVPGGLDLPAELARREGRLQALAAAKAEWEARAAARHQTEHPAYDGTMARREAPPGGYNPAWPSAPAAGAGSSRERSEQPDR